MSEDLYIRGIKPIDAKYVAYKQIYDNCNVFSLQPPCEVLDYFDDSDPHELGQTYNMTRANSPSVIEEYSTDQESGYLIFLDELPSDIKILQVYLS